MELRDLVVTPLLLILIYVLAYVIRPHVTDAINRRYFFPALTVKVIGALALGFIYQFYYHGGDTINYHSHGSRVIWEAFMESPILGIKIFFSQGKFEGELWDISDKIWYWRDPSSFKIIQIATIFDLITFSSYSGTAALFSVLSFVGAWMMFLTFYRLHPTALRLIAFSCLFIPSVVFWGSGILKDTVTLAFLGIATFYISKILNEKRIDIGVFLLLLLSFYVIYSIKKYILISFLAGIMVWVASVYFFKLRTLLSRILFVPIVILLCTFLTYFSINKVMADDPRYSLNALAKTAQVTAYDIRYGWGARSGNDQGSGYTLGDLDGTFVGMMKLAPKAINVTMFRPYLWEVKNVLMVLSALESLFTLIITIYVLFSVKGKVVNYAKSDVLFCLVFSVIFAFGVGVSTYNFGTLSRYKIPLLPYYWTAIALIYSSWREHKINGLNGSS